LRFTAQKANINYFSLASADVQHDVFHDEEILKKVREFL